MLKKEVYISIYIYIYVYILGGKEREGCICICIYKNCCIFVYMFTYCAYCAVL